MSHSIQFISLSAQQQFLFSMFATITVVKFRTFASPPKGIMTRLLSYSPFPPTLSCPGHSLIYFLSPQICIFWTYINGIMPYVIFCDCLFSYSIMFTGLTHVIACIQTFKNYFYTFYFLFIVYYYFIVWIYHTVAVHLLVDGHLRCFSILVIVSSATMNIHVHVFHISWLYIQEWN